MPLTRCEFEQHASNRWVAELEVGGISARRRLINAASFDELMAAIYEAYRAEHPLDQAVPAIPDAEPPADAPPPWRPTPPVGRDQAAKMRAAADKAADAGNPEARDRRSAMRARKL